MKKLFTYLTVILAVLVITHNTSFSQTYLGPRLGLNLATMVGENITKDDKKLNSGVQFGVTSIIPLCERVDFQPELLYSQQGLRYAGTTGGMRWSNSYNYNYLQI